VNESIRKNLPLITYELTYDEAVAKGALAFFGEKYGEKVRMIDISGHSMELCGGTHVSMTGEIGIFKILSESSVAAGVRRIEALTAQGALDYIEAMENWRIEIAKTLKAQPSEAAEKIKKLMERVRALEKDLRNAMSGRSEGGDVVDLASQAREIAGIGVLVKKVDVPDRKMLAELAEKYRDKLQGVVLLAAELDGKIALVAAVHKSLSGKVSAGDIAKKTSEILGGKGGGRPLAKIPVYLRTWPARPGVPHRPEIIFFVHSEDTIFGDMSLPQLFRFLVVAKTVTYRRFLSSPICPVRKPQPKSIASSLK